MPEKAHVTSLDALEAFRANLVIYLSKARPTLEEVSADVQRMRGWLENDQRMLWEGELRRRTRAMQQAQEALFSSKISRLREESAAEQAAFQRARRAVEDAQAKLRLIKQWNRDFDSRVQPLVKQMEKLHTLLSHDLVQGVASLTQSINTLAAYAEVKNTPGQPAPAKPEGTSS